MKVVGPCSSLRPQGGSGLRAPNVITAPAGAVFQRGQGWRVFVVDHGRARVRQVEIGHRTEASVEIVRGLTPGTKVVLFPSDKIEEGVRVRLPRKW